MGACNSVAGRAAQADAKAFKTVPFNHTEFKLELKQLSDRLQSRLYSREALAGFTDADGKMLRVSVMDKVPYKRVLLGLRASEPCTVTFECSSQEVWTRNIDTEWTPIFPTDAEKRRGFFGALPTEMVFHDMKFNAQDQPQVKLQFLVAEHRSEQQYHAMAKYRYELDGGHFIVDYGMGHVVP